MESDLGLKVASNFDLNPFSAWKDVPLSDFVREKVENLNINFTPSHRYSLSPILSYESLLLVSPSGTQRSTCTMIGLVSFIDPYLKDLQALVLIPRKTLIDEYLDTLLKFSKGLSLKIIKCVGGEPVNFKELKKAQIIVSSPGKLANLVETNKVSVNTLKIIVLDVANGLFYKEMKIQTDKIFAHLPDDAVYWFSSPISDEISKLKFIQKKPEGKMIEIIDERVLYGIKYYYKFYDTEETQFEFIFNRCAQFSGQVVIFTFDNQEMKRIYDYLEVFEPVLMNDEDETEVQLKIKEEFYKGAKKVLICYGSYHLVRKINCKESIEILNLDIVPAGLLISRARRASFKSDDKFISFFKEYEVEEIHKLEAELGIKFADASILD
jgi:superfamily II DNA/RNA helicase